MTLRTRIFIIVSLIVLFILGVSLFLIYYSTRTVEPTEPGATQNQSAGSPAQNVGQQPAPISGAVVPQQSSEEAIKNSAKQTAKIFIERYGSYSTDNNYDNIREVQTLATDSLWNSLSAAIGKPTDGKFVGVTTQAIGSSFVNYSNTNATVKVQTMRAETKDGSTTDTQRDVVVNLVWQNNMWLVSKFEWK
ncbi:MAG: hypothetical protein ABII98_01645 [bacterium]